jgi:photosystem II stability/assembly factor-like uncharacterized protein
MKNVILTVFVIFSLQQTAAQDLISPVYNPSSGYWSIGNTAKSPQNTDNVDVFTWQPIQTPVTYQITKVFFIDSLNGWAGHTGNGALRTTDSGFNWSTISFNDTNFTTSYNGVYFLNQNTGWIVGGALQIRKTTNGGVNWFKQYAPPAAGVLNNIYFFDENTGIAIGRKTINYNSFIARTTNSGSNWTEITATTANENELHSQIWFDNNNGWICGRNTLLKSTNGGLNYTNLYSNIPPISNGQNELLSIIFVNQQTGWIGGSNVDHKNIYITTNGGSNWTFQDNPVSGYTYSQINDVRFLTQDSGWAIHGTPASGAIMFTTNAGMNWVIEEGSNNWFNTIAVYDREKAWCGASAGKIWYALLSPEVGISNNNKNIPSKFTLFQNYPNPFNPVTKIKFSIPLSPLYERGVGGFVSLKIYDILGRAVVTLIPPPGGGQEGLPPGTYEVEFDGTNYPSGIYFYKLVTKSFTGIRKMVLLK